MRMCQSSERRVEKSLLLIGNAVEKDRRELFLGHGIDEAMI